MLPKLIKALIALALLLAAVLAANTLRQGSHQTDYPPAPRLTLDETGAANRLAGAVRIATVSDQIDAQANAPAFRTFHRHLETSFPRLHATLKREAINDFTLLYTWDAAGATVAAGASPAVSSTTAAAPGAATASAPARKPILLMAHMDVVPVDAATAKQWTHPPFAGTLAGEGGIAYVWGRGAWDNKSNLMSQMEAIETLLQAGFMPQQTIHLLLGADEEVNGVRGAGGAQKLFKERGTRFDFVLDEGLVITEGIIPGVAAPAALIGITQKGYMTAELAVRFAKGGHSSMPPKESVIGVLAEGVARIEKNPFPPRIKGVPEQMFATLAPEMGFPNRLFMSNLWLFGPLVQAKLAQSDATRAQLHTTSGTTLFHAGIKDNIIPSEARASINLRILPGDTSDTVIDALRNKAGDARIEISKPSFVVEPTRASSIAAPAFRALEKTVREIFPGTIVAPGLFTARADAGYLDALADNVYLFSPVRVGPKDTPRFHGIDERIAVANYVEMIRFYHRLIQNTAGSAGQ